MIVYDTKKWANSLLKIYLSFNRAFTTRVLFKYVFFVLIYSTAAVVIHEIFFKDADIDPTFFSLLGLVLGLILVFRLNSAYDRWWEGRKAWGGLINNARTLSAYLNSILPKDDQQGRKFFAVQIANFAMALQGHLRDDIRYDELENLDSEYINELKKAKQVPHKIAAMLFEKIETYNKAGVFSDFDKLNMKPQIAAMIDVLGICERIKKTPIPFSHSTFIKTFILIYIISLPFGIVDSLGYYAIPSVTLIGYALFGVEIISEEIEGPFGREANDLPLIDMSNVIKDNTFEILGSKPELEIPSVESNINTVKIVY